MTTPRSGSRGPTGAGVETAPFAARLFAATALALVLTLPSPVRAAEPTTGGLADAHTLFSQGSELFLARRYEEALSALRSSYRLVPSPNSGLLMARCLRELDRPREASETYATVEAAARQRVADGDAKYTQTADAAAGEGAAVRAQLGTLRIRVRHAPSGTEIDVDGAATPLPAEGSLDLLHRRGTVTVQVRPPTGVAQSQTVDLPAGSQVGMEFELGPQAPPPVASPPPPTSSAGAGDEGPWSRGWTRPAAWVSGGVAVVGTAGFVGFGLDSRATYDDLARRCGPSRCGAADRAEADSGKRSQLVANVGLAVGVVGVVATIGFVILSLTDHRVASAPGRGAAAASTTARAARVAAQLVGGAPVSFGQ